MDRYERIRKIIAEKYGTERHRVVAALGSHLHVDSSHVITELLQNAEDARATETVFNFCSDGLLVQNNGRPFSEEDLVALCSCFASEKDLSNVGFFGVGFKVVLQISRDPVLVSGAYCCRLERGTDPYELGPSELPVTPDHEKTYFWLPPRPNYEWKQMGDRFLQRFKNHGAELLLFLDNLRYIKWEAPGASLLYRAEREPLGEGAFLVTLAGDEISRWLRLDTYSVIPEEVVEAFIGRYSDILIPERRARLRSEEGRRHRVSIAFKIVNDRLDRVQGLAFARLPTTQETGLGFHIDARFQLALERSHLKDPREDPLVSWLLEQLARKASELPDRLVRIGWFKPSVWSLFPKAGEVEGCFAAIRDDLVRELNRGSFIHDDTEHLHPPQEVFLAHRAELYDLLTQEDLRDLTGVEKAVWPHPDLRRGRAAEILREVGAREIKASEVVKWLAGKLADEGWAQSRSDSWLLDLYDYLDKVRRVRDIEMILMMVELQIKYLPMIRSRSGRMLRPQDALFPPETEIDPALKPYLNYFEQVTVADLLREKAEEFLRWAGVKEFSWERLVGHLVQAEYSGRCPTPEENRRHLQIFKKLHDKGLLALKALQELGQNHSILRDRGGAYVQPAKAYLSPEYAVGSEEKEICAEMERFFLLSGGRPFVSPDYLTEEGTDEKEARSWRDFLLALGVADHPRPKEIRRKWTEWYEIKVKAAELGFSRPEYTYGYPNKLIDWEIDGLKEALDYLSTDSVTIEDLRAVWRTVAWLYKQIPSHRHERKAVLWYHRYRWHSKDSDASWVQRLRRLAWLWDQNGRRYPPEQLWAPELGKILGPGFSYLHPNLPFKGLYRELRRLLHIKTEADPAQVLDYLRKLRENNITEEQRIYPVYQYLAERQAAGSSQVKGAFQTEEPLILIPDKGWFQTGQVCWRDPLQFVPSIEVHWSEFRRFWREIGVCEEPTPNQYLHVLRELANKGELPPEAGLQKLCRKVWEGFSEEAINDFSLKSVRRWPGRLSSGQLVWADVNRLVLRDNDAIARLFSGRLTWWAFTDLQNLAVALGVVPVSKAEHKIRPGCGSVHEGEITRTLASYWPYLRWFLGNGISNRSPEVVRVASLELWYRLNDVESDPDETIFSFYLPEEGRLYFTGNSGLGWEEEVAEALALGLRAGEIREFAKDLFHYGGDSGKLQALLRQRRRFMGRDPAEVDKLLCSKAEEPGGEQIRRPEMKPREEPGAAPPEKVPGECPVGKDVEREEAAFHEKKGETPVRREEIRLMAPMAGGAGQGTKGKELTGHPFTSSEERLRVEQAALEAAKNWLESKGYQVREVGAYDVGCDLIASLPGGRKVWAEVKGRSGHSPIQLTEKQWECAEAQGENYWVIIVLVDKEDPTAAYSVYRIVDPARRPFEKREVKTVEYEAGYDQWKEWAQEFEVAERLTRTSEDFRRKTIGSY